MFDHYLGIKGTINGSGVIHIKNIGFYIFVSKKGHNVYKWNLPLTAKWMSTSQRGHRFIPL